MEENMWAEMSRFRGFPRISALAVSVLSCPPYCENDCGNKVTSEVDIPWYLAARFKYHFEGKKARI